MTYLTWPRSCVHAGLWNMLCGMTGILADQVPAVVVDTAITAQLASRDGRLRLLRVSVPALLAATALEDADAPMAARRSSADTAPLVGLQGISISLASHGAAPCRSKLYNSLFPVRGALNDWQGEEAMSKW